MNPTISKELSSELAATISESSSVISRAKDYLDLTKPRIMVLLLISTACPMIFAGGGQVSLSLVLWALLGGALVSGSASVLNCVWDKDIDAVMNRTKNRPLPQERVSVQEAVIFACALLAVGLWVLAAKLNPLAAWISLAGHLFYVIVYTIILKRSSEQNIVIGGAAGAVPPVVGWVGVTGRVDMEALLLFLIIFLWTPPHFWALAMNKNADYQRAGVPMMPVISGEKRTQRQMFWYALSLLPISLLLVLVNRSLGWFSLLMFSALGATFVYKVHCLRPLVENLGFSNNDEKTKRAWDVFWFSILYLTLIFCVLVVDAMLL